MDQSPAYLRHRTEISCTIFLAVAGALRGCPPLAVLVLRRDVRPHIASRYDRQIAHLIPARRLSAKRHVERKIGFYIHLAVYLVVNTGLVLFNVLVVPAKIWAFWPLFGWGIGLLFHALAVFLHAPGAAWKERMIEDALKKYHQQ